MGWDSPVKDAGQSVLHRTQRPWRPGAGSKASTNWSPAAATNGLAIPAWTTANWLTLHGRAANIPASKVTLHIDEKPPYAISLRGELKEQAFKKVDFSVMTELVTEPGSVAFTLSDILTNNGDYPKEYQALYHSNFSTPFLEQGARFVAPVKQVSPFNDKAKGDLPDWQTYRAPTKDYDETVYNVVPYGDAKGDTLTVLHNKAEVSVGRF